MSYWEVVWLGQVKGLLNPLTALHLIRVICLSLSIWRPRQRVRAAGGDIPYSSDCSNYLGVTLYLQFVWMDGWMGETAGQHQVFRSDLSNTGIKI